MRNSILLSLMFFMGCSAFGQNDQADINQQVWKPFIQAIMKQDVAGFIAVHSKDVVRVELSQDNLMDYATYKTAMEKSWPNWREYNQKNKVQYTFELRFLQRMSNGTQAFETGYYKNETVVDGEKKVSYGKFQVALRKENGVWKILVDSDTDEGGTITTEMFLKAGALE
jgi:ketosteroid isomerase-like protein